MTGRAPAPRPWPFAPLERAAGADSIRTLAIALHTYERRICRWRAEGLTDREADQLAIFVGSHPALIWPGWHAAAVGELVDVA